jgi:hypothetical protein
MRGGHACLELRLLLALQSLGLLLLTGLILALAYRLCGLWRLWSGFTGACVRVWDRRSHGSHGRRSTERVTAVLQALQPRLLLARFLGLALSGAAFRLRHALFAQLFGLGHGLLLLPRVFVRVHARLLDDR